MVRRLILRSFQSPGDVLMLTAAVRDLHAAAPGQFQTDVRTSAPALWDHNPYLTPLREGEPGVEVLDMHYPLIHQSNQRPYHFLHGYPHYLEQQLGLRIPVTRFHGDVHLGTQEKEALPAAASARLPESFWILVAGGKYDFTAKWWDPECFQAVVDHFRGRITFAQCGERGHWHPRLQGVVDLVGQTSLRDFVRLMYHAAGVLCPVTLAMHLAAAVETPPGRPTLRACVVVAGGREPAHWEAYPGHQFLSTVGLLPCCAGGGCWKSRCQLAGDGDAKDRENLCERPVQVQADLRIPQCMHLITPRDVIRHLELYYQGAIMPSLPTSVAGNDTVASQITARSYRASLVGKQQRRVLVDFRHGLGDAVQLTLVLRHLRRHHPSWHLEVAALVGKHSAYHGLCDRVLVLDRDRIDRPSYEDVFVLDWHECRTAQAQWPSTKPIRCLQEVFRLAPVAELCHYKIQCSEPVKERARRYLAGICPQGPDASGRHPAVLIHYQANTSTEHKDLPHDLIREACEVILQAGFVPVILDWDRRSPLIDGVRIHNPDAGHELWGGTGTGDAETLAALIEASSLLIGVDSGPLHVAGATTTPAIGVWTGHHPVHYFDWADNVLHLVPGDHEKLAAGPLCLQHFASHYRHRTYKQLYIDLLGLVESQLTGVDVDQLANKRFLRQLRATAYGERYYQEHKLSGLDYLGFGDWQQRYGRWLVESLDLKGKRLLDVGCACGSILRGLGEAGAVVQGVEINEHMVQLGRQKWPDMASLLLICDAVNLHLFPDTSWDVIHTSQVAEHWKPELVPHILRELARVSRPGGLLFCCLDTEELFARQGRRLEEEDPTHVCIRPRAWWHERLSEAGWRVCSVEVEPRLKQHSDSFLKRYDWDWFVARKEG